jgi:hypothetical protein
MTKALALSLLLLASPVAAVAQAPADADLAIAVRGYTTTIGGAESASGVTYNASAIVGKTVTGAMGMARCGYFAATSRADVPEDMDVGWRLQFTPTRVGPDVVTFRLRWTRAVNRLGSSVEPPPGGDIEMTLKLGESRPLDRVMVAQSAKTLDGKPCDREEATLRVAIEPSPLEQFDRRLIATDLWLVERLPDGKERTQQLALRSLPNRTASFYFDAIRTGESSLDIYGHVLTRLDGDSVELAFEIISRWDASPPIYPYRWLRSAVHVRPGEVIDIPLPKLGKEAGAFGDRSLSLRVRAKRIR